MIHTYRDPEALRSSSFASHVVSWVALCALSVGVLAFTGFSLAWDEAVVGGFVGLVLLLQYRAYRRQQTRSCGEIRLSDDGTCEFETRRGAIRLHVTEIRSVKYSPKGDETSESYTIHYQDGNLDVTKRMTGFLDFLTRLKTLNPAVDLSSFPDFLADSLPGQGTRVIADHRDPVKLFFRSALFPLIVVALLVYLASQTFVGK